MIKLNILNANNFSDMMYGKKALFYSPDTDDIKELVLNLNFGNEGMKATITHIDDTTTDYQIFVVSAMSSCNLLVALRRYSETIEEVEEQMDNIRRIISETETKRFNLTKKLMERAVNHIKAGGSDKEETTTPAEMKEIDKLTNKIKEGEEKLNETGDKLRVIKSDKNKIFILLSWTFWKKLKLKFLLFLTKILPTKD